MKYVEPIIIEHEGEEYWGLPLEKEVDETIFTVLRHSSRRAHSSECASGSNCKSDPIGTTMIAGHADYDILKRSTSGAKRSVVSYCKKCLLGRSHLEEYREYLDKADEWVREQRAKQ